MGEPETQKTFKLPILPAFPCDALQGKKITQEMIASALAYNPKFRPAYVYVNPNETHERKNGEIAASVLRTFREGDHVVAEVLPHRRYRGEKFEELAAADGDFPGRSVDLWNKSLIPDCPTEYNLEGIALCGANKPAVRNLPAIYFSAQTDQGILTFSVITGEKTMSEENKDEKSALQKQIDDLKSQLKKKDDEILTLSTEGDHYKKESQAFATQLNDFQKKLDRQEVDQFFNDNLKLKIKTDEREGLIALALSLKNEKVELAAGQKSRYDQFLESLKNRPDVVKLSVVAGGIGTEVTGGSEQPMTRTSAIFQFATEAKLDPATKPEDYDKAEDGARKKWPELFRKEAR